MFQPRIVGNAKDYRRLASSNNSCANEDYPMKTALIINQNYTCAICSYAHFKTKSGRPALDIFGYFGTRRRFKREMALESKTTSLSPALAYGTEM